MQTDSSPNYMGSAKEKRFYNRKMIKVFTVRHKDAHCPKLRIDNGDLDAVCT